MATQMLVPLITIDLSPARSGARASLAELFEIGGDNIAPPMNTQTAKVPVSSDRRTAGIRSTFFTVAGIGAIVTLSREYWRLLMSGTRRDNSGTSHCLPGLRDL